MVSFLPNCDFSDASFSSTRYATINKILFSEFIITFWFSIRMIWIHCLWQTTKAWKTECIRIYDDTVDRSLQLVFSYWFLIKYNWSRRKHRTFLSVEQPAESMTCTMSPSMFAAVICGMTRHWTWSSSKNFNCVIYRIMKEVQDYSVRYCSSLSTITNTMSAILTRLQNFLASEKLGERLSVIIRTRHDHMSDPQCVCTMLSIGSNIRTVARPQHN